MLQIVGHRRQHRVLDLVVLEILLAQIWTLLENHHAESRGREFLGDDTARRARADHQKIYFFRGPVLLHRSRSAS